MFGCQSARLTNQCNYEEEAQIPVHDVAWQSSIYVLKKSEKTKTSISTLKCSSGQKVGADPSVHTLYEKVSIPGEQ